MEPCKRNPECLSAYIDGELAAEERGALEEHLTRCEVCRREVEVLRLLREVEEQLPLEPVSPAEWERVWSGVERSLVWLRGGRRVRWWVELVGGLMSYRPALAAAVLAAAMVVAGFVAIALHRFPSTSLPSDETFAVAKSSDLTLETIAYDCENYTLVVKAPRGGMAPVLWLTPTASAAPSENGT